MIQPIVRRSQGGMSLLICISAATLPIWFCIASVHLNHWLGGEDSTAWQGVIAPWSALIWAVISSLSLGAWSAYLPFGDLENPRIWTSDLAVGTIGLSICMAVSIPGWVWLTQVGDVPVDLVARCAVLSTLPPILVVGAAVVIARFVDRRVAVVGSWSVGALGLWAISGSL